MPFRTISQTVEEGEPRKLLTAGADDIEVEVRSAGFGGVQSSAGYSFVVGGPEVEHGGGLHVFSGQWSSQLSEGDQVWVAAAGRVEFGSGTPITAIVRSRPRPADGPPEGQ